LIKIDRPKKVPAVLRNEGVTETARNVQKVRADLGAYRSGAKKLEFDREIYGHASVKRVMIRAQRGKCAFCESEFRVVSFGDMEHFRPKGGFRRRSRGALQRPGYYWLAYAWENILASCEICNRRFKRNHFPLEKGSCRVRGPAGDCSKERALLIDPAAEDPDRFLAWHEHRVVARKGDRRARVTLRVLGLNRKTLRAARARLLETVARMLDLVDEHPATAARVRAEAWLRMAVLPDRPYSGMVRAYLESRGFVV
jgi:uncharacterized protein (TIGR02646 family)